MPDLQTLEPNYAEIRSARELRAILEQQGCSVSVFNHSTMELFGDMMFNFRVRHHHKNTDRHIVELYRLKPVRSGLQTSTYFRTDNNGNLIRMFPVKRQLRKGFTEGLNND
jgi:hypothetical protein